MLSYWEKKFWYPFYDYCVVGAGIVGLTTALLLKQRKPDKKIAILDRGIIPTGASTRNAGFACYGTVGEILDDLSHIPEDQVIETIKLRWEGLQALNALHESNSIEYKQSGGEELFSTKEAFENCADSLSVVNKLLLEATGQKNTILINNQSISSQLYSQSLLNPLEGKLNPVKLIHSLLRKVRLIGIDVHLGVELKSFSVDNTRINMNFGALEIPMETDNLLFTTNAFTQQFIPELDIKPARNQVLVSKPLPGLKMEGTYHVEKGYIYFRSINGRLLLGGARHIDAEKELTEKFGSNETIKNYLKGFANENFGIEASAFTESWSGIIATGRSKNPIIKQVNSGVYVAARLGGMGVATGSAVAHKLVDLVSSH